MTWLAWRQHRAQALVVAAMLALAAAALAVQRMATAGLSPQGDPNGGLNTLAVLEIVAMMLVPGLLGLFLGAPLVARELETGTHRLAWAQSISRTRWLLLAVAVVLGIGLGAAAASSALVSWALAPWVALQQKVGNPGWFNSGTFDAVGVVPVAYALFALALGIASGAVLRRTLLAMFVVLVLFTAVRIPIAVAARPNYEPPARIITNALSDLDPGQLDRSGAWVVGINMIDPQGQ